MKNKEKGFTLLEVLVAIVIFSFGLLGLAGMMTISVRNNHNGYLRSQANFFAENMMDRMRANPQALWLGAYDGDANTGGTNCDMNNPCNFQELAAYDMEQWAQSVGTLLPSGQGNITCDNSATLPGTVTGATPPSIWLPVPPYPGVCTVTITWNESNETGSQDDQELVLVSTP